MDSVIQLMNLELDTQSIDSLFIRIKDKATITKITSSYFSISFKEIPVKLFLEVQLEVGCDIFKIDIQDKRSTDNPYKDSDTKDSLIDTNRVLFYIKKYLGD